MYIELARLSPNEVYFAMTQTVIPRPIAWVLSDNGNGSYNLAPFSYFNGICSDPPLIYLSVGKKSDGTHKDTRVNIEARSHFVVHLVHRELGEAMVETSRSLPHGESELDRIALQLTEFKGFSLPRLADCRVAFACKLHQIQEIGATPQSLILGELISIYVEDAAAGKDAKGRPKIHAAKIEPIGRLGGSEYSSFGEIFDIPRPK
jgi:flavin reductase (DIM6/NTAB) family NADH-FMN oxidoreductase RutF